MENKEDERVCSTADQPVKARRDKRDAHWRRFLLFARGFIKYPNMVGWMLPSSPFLVDEVLKQVDWERARLVVEYGPGIGTFTKRVLDCMHPQARLIALETNPEFCQYLGTALHDPRLYLVQQSAVEIESVLARLGFPQADYVISGIPFRTLPHNARLSIVRKTHAVLRPNGRFLVYQFSNAVRPYLESVFRQVSRDVELLNLIPARLFFCAP